MSAINRLKIFSSYLTRQTRNTGMPAEICIEVTNACNLACTMCPRTKMTRPVGFMEMPLLKKILQEIQPYTELVYLHGLGEPLMHPQLGEMIREVKAHGIACGLSTNITYLDREKSRMLIESGLDYLILPMEGTTKEVYEKIRVNSNFDKVLRNIDTFFEVEKELGRQIYTVIQMIAQDMNSHQVQELVSKWQGHKMVNEVRVKPWQNLNQDEIGHTRYSGNNGNGNARPRPCFYIWRQHDIFWDGSVSLCCMDTDKEFPDAGNFHEQSLEEIWNGEFFQGIRRKHVEGRAHEINLCRVCNIPQPNEISTYGLSFVPALAVKKLLPKVENMSVMKFFK